MNLFARLCNFMNKYIVWNFIIAFYFLNYIKLSLFLWANIGLLPFESSILGNINLHLSILLKFIQIGSFYWIFQIINNNSKQTNKI